MTTESNSSDVFRSLMDVSKLEEKVETAKQKKMKLEESADQVMSQYQQVTAKILKGEAGVEDLSKLEEGMKAGQQCTQEIYQIAEGLSAVFNNCGQLVDQMMQYKGWKEEWAQRLGMDKVAYNLMVQRVKKQDINQNLEHVVQLGHLMVHQTNEAIVKNTECYHTITNAIKLSTQELSDNQPLYEKWRAEEAKLEARIAEIKSLQVNADEKQSVKLLEELQTVQDNYNAAKFNRSNFFDKYDKARQALNVQPMHQKFYSDAISGLNTIKNRLDADIRHNSPMFFSIKKLIDTGLTVKSAEQYNDSQRAALDKITNVGQKISAGILDTAAKVAESWNLDPNKTAAYNDASEKERASFMARIRAVESRYSKQDNAGAGS